MSSINNNKKQQTKNVHSNSCENDFFRDTNDFHMDIKDEFTDPLDNMVGFNKHGWIQ